MNSVGSKSANTAILLLAAGGSARLGRPKQLLPYEDETLLHYSVKTALASGTQPVVVVLGANADILQNELKNTDVQVEVNEDWQEGMASSIRCGIKAIAAIAPDAEGIILMMCDQPFVTPGLLNELIAAHQKTGKQIVACSYEDTFGPPAFFHHTLFDELLRLKGDIGARSIVRHHTDMVEIIPFAGGTFDVDTEADYEKLKTKAIIDKEQQ